MNVTKILDELGRDKVEAIDMKSMRFGMRLARDAIREACEKAAQIAVSPDARKALSIMAEELKSFPLVGSSEHDL